MFEICFDKPSLVVYNPSVVFRLNTAGGFFMRKKRLSFYLAAAMFLCIGWAVPVKAEEASRDLFAMDTYMSVSAYGNGEAANAAADAAVSEINRLDALFSVGIETSDIAVLNSQKQAAVSAETACLLERSQEIHDLTDGAFDISIFPLMEAWGFTSGNYRVPGQDELNALLPAVDMSKIRLDADAGKAELTAEDVRIDLGAIAKGYTSARLMEIFREHGITSAKVSLGGNVQVLGRKPDGSLWRIGIESASGSDLAGVLETACIDSR